MEGPEEKRPLGRPRRRWNDNIKMYLQDWIDLAQHGNRREIVVMRSWTICLHKMQGIS